MNLKSILILLLFPFFAFAQEESKTSFSKKLEKYKIQPIGAMQLWTTYTIGMEQYNDSEGRYLPVDDRLNIHVQRTRFGFKGQPYENLSFNLIGSFDFVGRDVLSGTVGGSNNGGSPNLRLWNAKLQWRISNDESFNIVAGYIPTPIGRENNTAATRTITMEKAWSQNYLRRHLLGVGHGRAGGLIVGGLFGKSLDKFGFKYDFGVFTPQFHSFAGNSVGTQAPPLWTGKLAFNIGEPESKKYTTGYKSNYFGKRNGATIAFSGAYQGQTDLFTENLAYGMEYGIHYQNFNLDGEYHLMNRKGFDVFTGPTDKPIEADGAVWFSRISVNLPLENGRIVTPYLMAMQYAGTVTKQERFDASLLNSFSGKDEEISAGIIYYFNPDMKLTFNYTFRGGVPAEGNESATFNNYFQQGGVGAIKRGNWAGVGLVVVL